MIYFGNTTTLATMIAIIAASLTAANASEQFNGVAAFYSRGYSGKTASGAQYDPKKFTCAHRTLPFGTRLHVTDAKSHRSVDVVVNDRGPFTKGRVLDFSLAAAEALHMMDRGIIQVTATTE
jgi:peptidoglycan lytic transglycosylase